MSYWFKDYEVLGTVTISGVDYQSVVGVLYADTSADLPPRLVGSRALAISSTCTDVSTGDKYMMDTYGNWNLQPTSTSVSLDLSGYYTSAEVDAAITAAVNSALASYTTTADMNTAINTAIMTTQYTNRGTEPADGADILDLPVGRYFKSSNAQTLVNIPSTFTGAACVFEIRNTTTTTGTRMRIDFWSCSPNNEPHYWFAVKASTPAVWKPWIEMTGTVLT